MPRASIIARRVIHNGQPRYRVAVPKHLQESGEPKKRFFIERDGKGSANEFIASLEKRRKGGNQWFAGQPQHVQDAIRMAVGMLGDGQAHNLPDAAKLWKAQHGTERKTISEVIALAIAAKESTSKRKRYTSALKAEWERFSEGRGETPIHEIGSDEIERWINASFPVRKFDKEKKAFVVVDWKPPSPGTKRARQINLQTLFSFAVKRGWCKANPVSKLERHKRPKKEPTILTPQQCAAVLKAATELHSGDLLALVALQLFGGIRPEESYKLTEAHIRPDVIRISADIAKTSDVRNVTRNDTLNAWLAFALTLGAHPGEWKGKLQPWDYWRRMSKIRKASEVQPWPQDCCRHSYVSYHMPIYGWEKTVAEAGHSLAMSFKHYRALVTESEARKFWAILPGENSLK